MLSADILEFVRFSSCQALEDIIAITREWEIDFVKLKKSKVEHVHIDGGPAKRPNASDK